jgi:DNA polymerase I-like protein with 3'-5' exonuclease and polymerase domains
MKAFRQDVKSGWVLALFFGALCSTAARHIKVDEVILKPLYDEFWREFSGIKDWQVANNTFYEENGYVEFLTGRRRCGPLGFNVRINSPIQIGEAEITLDGANRISEMDIWETQPVLMIHDDNILHVPEEMVDDVLAVLISEMVKPDVFDFINVPIVVEVKRGKTWGDMKVVGTYSSVEFYGKDRHLGLREGEL